MKNSEIYLNLLMSCQLICRLCQIITLQLVCNPALTLIQPVRIIDTSKITSVHAGVFRGGCQLVGFLFLNFKFITGKWRKTNLYLAQIFLLFLYIVSKVKSSQVRTILSQLNASWLCSLYDSTNIFTLVIEVCKKNLITNVTRRKKCLTGSLQLTQKTVDRIRVGIFPLRVPESGQVGPDFSPQDFPLQIASMRESFAQTETMVSP